MELKIRSQAIVSHTQKRTANIKLTWGSCNTSEWKTRTGRRFTRGYSWIVPSGKTADGTPWKQILAKPPRAVVIFKQGIFSTKDFEPGGWNKYYKVIGNIYENPELLNWSCQLIQGTLYSVRCISSFFKKGNAEFFQNSGKRFFLKLLPMRRVGNSEDFFKR